MPGKQIKLDRLLLIYQIERSDQQNASILNAAVVSVALAYIVAVTAFLSDPTSLKSLGALALLTPFPVLSLNGYITMQVGAGVARRSYLVHLEALIGSKKKYLTSHPRFVSLYHSLFLGWPSLVTSVLTALTFFSPLATSALFSAYVVGPVAQRAHAELASVLVALIGYSVMVLLNLTAIGVVYFQIRGQRDQIRERAKIRLTTARTMWS